MGSKAFKWDKVERLAGGAGKWEEPGYRSGFGPGFPRAIKALAALSIIKCTKVSRSKVRTM